MPNPTNTNEECPICGGVIWKGQKVLIEGAKITVCQNCAQHGKRISEKTSFSSGKRVATPKSTTKKQRPVYDKEIEEPSTEIVADYAQTIQHARMKRNLTQEKFAEKIQEKLSLIRRIEAGKMKPSIQLAEKIGNYLDIKLIKEVKDTPVDYNEYLKKSKGSSLGDIAFIKRKK